MKLFRKQYGQPGAQPGLINNAIDGAINLTFNLTLFSFNQHQVVEKEDITIEHCSEYVDKEKVTWVHVQGSPNKATLNQLASDFGIHDLYMEDVANSSERPKLETHEGQVFTILSLPVQTDENIYLQQVSLFLLEGTVISFCSGQFNPFAGVKTRLKHASGKMRNHKADYLFYSLIDSIIDWCFPVLERYAQLIDSTEELLLKYHDKEILHKIHQLRRDVLLLRRQIWPQRELLNQLIRDDTQNLISVETKVFLRDCYDHSISLLELIETYHEMINGLMELYMSLVSLKLNEVMRVLTIIATLFIPPTFVVGIYGMNFNPKAGPLSMPELLSPYGYIAVWLIILSMVCGMLVFFRKRKWL